MNSISKKISVLFSIACALLLKNGFDPSLPKDIASSISMTPIQASSAPNGKDISWRSVGPGGGGWIQSIAWDPKNADILYVGCDVGGFYISHNRGVQYEIRNNGLNNYFIQGISVDPRDTRIILLATEGGVYRTTDQGRHWNSIRNGFPPIQRYSFSAPIGCISFDPNHPTIAFAGVGRPRWGNGGDGTIYRSEDTGLTWRVVTAGQLPKDAIVSDIEVQPGNSRVVLAATDRGVYRSANGGFTWIPSNTGLPQLDCQKLVFSESSPNIAYLSLNTTARDGQPWNGGVYRSVNAGVTWRSVNGAGMNERVGKSGDSPYHSDSIMALTVNPRNANEVYAADHDWINAGVLKSTDGGTTWEEIARHTGNGSNMQYGWIDFWGPSVECMALSSADPGEVAIGTSGHVFVTEDGRKSWNQRYCTMSRDGRFTGTGLETTCPNTVISSVVSKSKAYYCYADIGLLISDDNGRSFYRSYKGMKYAGNCFTVVENPAHPKTLWAGTGQWERNAGDICRSDDGGATWQIVGDPESGMPDGQTKYLVLDAKSPESRSRLIASCEGHGIYESKDGGESWKCINGNLPMDACKKPRGMLMDPSDSNHLIAVFNGSPENGSGVYETINDGITWRKLNTNDDFADILCITADPHNFSTLYLGAQDTYDQSSKRAYSGGVYKSTDGGKTWRSMLKVYTVSSIAINSKQPQELYAGTNDYPYHDDYAAEGVLKSEDGGVTWVHENTGLSLLNVNSISVSPMEPSQLYLCTGGNGVFRGKEMK